MGILERVTVLGTRLDPEIAGVRRPYLLGWWKYTGRVKRVDVMVENAGRAKTARR
jgi:hypothetical protein